MRFFRLARRLWRTCLTQLQRRDQLQDGLGSFCYGSDPELHAGVHCTVDSGIVSVRGSIYLLGKSNDFSSKIDNLYVFFTSIRSTVIAEMVRPTTWVKICSGLDSSGIRGHLALL